MLLYIFLEQKWAYSALNIYFMQERLKSVVTPQEDKVCPEVWVMPLGNLGNATGLRVFLSQWCFTWSLPLEQCGHRHWTKFSSCLNSEWHSARAEVFVHTDFYHISVLMATAGCWLWSPFSYIRQTYKQLAIFKSPFWSILWESLGNLMWIV